MKMAVSKEQHRPSRRTVRSLAVWRFASVLSVATLIGPGVHVPANGQTAANAAREAGGAYAFRIRAAPRTLEMRAGSAAEVLVIEGGPATAVASSDEGVATAALSPSARGYKVRITAGSIGGRAVITVMNDRGTTDATTVTVFSSPVGLVALTTVPPGPIRIVSNVQSLPFRILGGRPPYAIEVLAGSAGAIAEVRSGGRGEEFTIEREDRGAGGAVTLLVTDDTAPVRQFLVLRVTMDSTPPSMEFVRSNLCVRGTDPNSDETLRAIRAFQRSIGEKPTPSGTLSLEQIAQVRDLGVCPEPFRTYYEKLFLSTQQDVMLLQSDLNTARAGALIPMREPLPTSGHLGSLTRQALKLLQIRYGVSPADGIYTQETEQLARAKIAGDFPEAGLGDEKRRRVQRSLCVEDDGIYGPKTRRSIKEYQLVQSGEDTTAATGKLNADQAGKLDIEPECPPQYGTYYEARQLGFVALLSERSIKELQTKLNAADGKSGFVLDSQLDVNGELDDNTRAALEKFQRATGVSPADGLYSKATRDKLTEITR